MEGVIERGAPGRLLESITPSATVNFTNGICRAIWVGVAGNVEVVPPEGSAVVLVGALAGSIIPVQAKRVNAAGTTATNLVAIF